MSKSESRSKNRIFILGCIIIGVTGLLLIYGLLVVTGVIHLKENKLVFTAESKSKLYDGTPLIAEGWEMTSGELMMGHYAVAKVSGKITEPGTVDSTVSVIIYDSQQVDVTDEYNVHCVAGTLQVFGRRLVLTSDSAEKIYDGTALTAPRCVIREGSLMNGHKIELEALGSIDKIGKKDNTIKFAITDRAGNDVSRYYDIVKEIGVLEIKGIPYTVKTESDTKLYDGEPLTCGEFTEFGNLMPGHKSTVKVTGKIVGEGTAPNSATVKITDESGRDVSDLYEINVDAGTLEVVGPPKKNDSSEGGNGSSGSGAGASSVSGSISGSDLNNPSNDSEEKSKVEVFRVTATRGGRILFRTDTFGAYTYHGWDDAPAETDPIALYYTSREMKRCDLRMDYATVETVTDYGYLLPYYADEYTVNTSLRDYTVGYMAYDHLKNPIPEVTETDTERAYREFVYANYLRLPSDTKAAILKILEDEGLNAASTSVIGQVAWVERYVKNAATYNLKFKPYPEMVDTAIYFLTEAKEGVCRHYATAATVALRALGIPARYTVGFAADVQADVTTVVTGDKAHAWVEVYIDGLGWIAIDPTGGDGGAGGSGGADGSGDAEGGGDTDLEGTIPSKGNGGGDVNGSGSIKPFMNFIAETNGRFYFRQKHFGAYDPLGRWGSAPSGEDLHSATLATEALRGYAPTHTVEISPVSNMIYLYPYYTSKESIKPFDGISPYTLEYCAFDLMTAKDLPLQLGEYAAYEEKYREYVYANYIALPEGTRSEMEALAVRLADESGVRLSEMTAAEIVKWAVDYISDNCVYNKNFADFPAGVDMAVYFLAEGREGVDAHFATSAATLLRALGIPARYAMGYSVNASAFEVTGVNSLMAAAWAEVYLDGFGWVVIDPMKDARVDVSDGEGVEDDGRINITLIPNDGSKEYDGAPLTAEEKGHKIKGSTQLFGKDELIVTYDGEITEPGKAIGRIVSCIAVNEYGEDVSYRYNFDISATSTLEVKKRKVYVYSDDDIKVYDGAPLTCHYLVSGYSKYLLDGHFIDAEFSGAQTEIGKSDNVFKAKIVDGRGKEIEGWERFYDLRTVYGSLRVVYSYLVFETDGVTKEYDGAPVVTGGACRYLSGELMEGHYIYSAVADKSRTTPGSTLNMPTVIIKDGAGNDVSYMYALSEEKLGYIRVTRIKLKVVSGSAEAYYDPQNPGNTLTCSDYTYEGALLENHTVEVQISGQISSVGYCDNQIDFVTVYDESGKNVSEYYDIEAVDGTLTILPPS